MPAVFVELFFGSGGVVVCGKVCAASGVRGVALPYWGCRLAYWNDFVDLFCAWLLVCTLLTNVREKAL